ncbi:hypothetical protein GQR58_012782 [Nymphon striatum]|nr:hypothetical protein GQR58_012782 [Nymphon striatum]
MGLQETFLLQSILKRKASFFGHIARGSAGEELKMIVAEGWRKIGRGRRRRRWMDDLELVTGTKDVRKNMEMAEDKERWREKYQVMKMCWQRTPHQRPSMQKISTLLKYLNENLSLSGNQLAEFEERWASFNPNFKKEHNLPEEVLRNKDFSLKFETNFNPKSQFSMAHMHVFHRHQVELARLSATRFLHSSLSFIAFRSASILHVFNGDLEYDHRAADREDWRPLLSSGPVRTDDDDDVEAYFKNFTSSISDISPSQEISSSSLRGFEAGEFVPNVVSPSLQNLRGSIEDITAPASPQPTPLNFSSDIDDFECNSLRTINGIMERLPPEGAPNCSDSSQKDFDSLESWKNEIASEANSQKVMDFLKLTVIDSDNSDLESPHHPNASVCNNNLRSQQGEQHDVSFTKGFGNMSHEECPGDGLNSKITNKKSKNPFITPDTTKLTENAPCEKYDNNIETREFEPSRFNVKDSVTEQRSASVPFSDGQASPIHSAVQDNAFEPLLKPASQPTHDDTIKTENTFESNFCRQSLTSTPRKAHSPIELDNIELSLVANETILDTCSSNDLFVTALQSQNSSYQTADKDSPCFKSMMEPADEEKFGSFEDTSKNLLVSFENLESSQPNFEATIKPNDSTNFELSHKSEKNSTLNETLEDFNDPQQIDKFISDSFIFLEKSDLDDESISRESTPSKLSDQLAVEEEVGIKNDWVCFNEPHENVEVSVDSEVPLHHAESEKSVDISEIDLDGHRKGSLIPREIPETISYPPPEEIVAKTEYLCGNEPTVKSAEDQNDVNKTSPKKVEDSSKFEINLDGHRKGSLIPREIPETISYPPPEEIVAKTEYLCGNEPTLKSAEDQNDVNKTSPKKVEDSSNFEINLDGHRKGSLIPREIPETISYPPPEEIVAKTEYLCGNEPTIKSAEDQNDVNKTSPKKAEDSSNFEINLDGHRKGSLIPREIPETISYPPPEEIVAKMEYLCGNEPTVKSAEDQNDVNKTSPKKVEDSSNFEINLDGHRKGSLIPREIPETISYPPPEEIVAKTEYLCGNEPTVKSAEDQDDVNRTSPKKVEDSSNFEINLDGHRKGSLIPREIPKTISYPPPEEIVAKTEYLCGNEPTIKSAEDQNDVNKTSPKKAEDSSNFEINLDGHRKGSLIPREIPETISYPPPEEIVAKTEYLCGNEPTVKRAEDQNDVNKTSPKNVEDSSNFEINLDGHRKGSLIPREIPETISYPPPEEIVAKTEYLCGNEPTVKSAEDQNDVNKTSPKKAEDSSNFEINLDGHRKGSLIPREIPETISYPPPEEIVAKTEYLCGNEPTVKRVEDQNDVNKTSPKNVEDSSNFEINLDGHRKGSLIPREIPETVSYPPPEEIVAKTEYLCGNEPTVKSTEDQNDVNRTSPKKVEDSSNFEINLDGHRKGSLIPREIPETVSYPPPEEIVAKTEYLCGNEPTVKNAEDQNYVNKTSPKKVEDSSNFEINLDGDRKDLLIPGEIPETISIGNESGEKPLFSFDEITNLLTSPSTAELEKSNEISEKNVDLLCGISFELVDTNVETPSNDDLANKVPPLSLEADTENRSSDLASDVTFRKNNHDSENLSGQHKVMEEKELLSGITGKDVISQECCFYPNVNELTENAFQNKENKMVALPDTETQDLVTTSDQDSFEVNSNSTNSENALDVFESPMISLKVNEISPKTLPSNLLVSIEKDISSPELLCIDAKSELDEEIVSVSSPDSALLLMDDSKSLSSIENIDSDSNDIKEIIIPNNTQPSKIRNNYENVPLHPSLDSNDVLIVDTQTNEALMVDKDSLEIIEDLMRETSLNLNDSRELYSGDLLQSDGDESNCVEIGSDSENSISSEDAADEFVSSWRSQTSSNELPAPINGCASKSSSSGSLEEIDTSQSEVREMSAS